MDETNDKKSENGFGKPKNGKPKFNYLWIYALLAVLIIGLQFMNSWGDSPKPVGWGEVKTMVENQDIERLVLVNKELAEIYIKKEKFNLPRHKEVKPSEGFGGTKPQYTYTIGSVETFEKDFAELQQGIEKPVYIENLTRRNVWGDALSWILPVALLVGAWFFIMRMMSRGSGGGGQIFNIGKSKAQLFDKDTHVNINFSDVAGLEEAKVEIMEIVDFLKNPKKIYHTWR
jgi:cell division protease FtsH